MPEKFTYERPPESFSGHAHYLEMIGATGERMGEIEMRYIGKPSPFYYVQSIMVFPRFKGQGYGSRLVEKTNAFLKEKGRAGILYNMILEEYLRPLYARHGWKKHTIAGNDWYSFNLPDGVTEDALKRAIARCPSEH